MPDRDAKVHVARNGSLIGTYEFDQLGDLVERGQLLQSDQYFDELKGEWIALSERLGGRSTKEFRPAQERAVSEDPKSGSRRHGSGRSARSKKNTPTSIFGWIACLFALCIAAGIWAYASVLQDRIRTLESKLASSEATEATLRKELQVLGELTPVGRVRAVITYEPSPNQVAIMSGATVALYRREDVESALRSGPPMGPGSSPEEFERGVENLRNTIPSPIAVTLTDSNGRVDLPLPGEGNYVLVASAGKSVNGVTERMLWLMGFPSSADPSPVMVLGEKNAITLRRPNFRIVERTGMASETAPAP